MGEMIFEGYVDEKDEEMHKKDLEQAPLKFEDLQHQVHDPIEEVNLDIMEELKLPMSFPYSLLT